MSKDSETLAALKRLTDFGLNEAEAERMLEVIAKGALGFDMPLEMAVLGFIRSAEEIEKATAETKKFFSILT